MKRRGKGGRVERTNNENLLSNEHAKSKRFRRETIVGLKIGIMRKRIG